MSDLSEKQTQILSAFLRFLVLLGGIAYVPSLIACIRDNLFLLAVIDTFAFAVVIVIAFHRGISYRIRLWITVIVTLFIGGIGGKQSDPLGARRSVSTPAGHAAGINQTGNRQD